MGRHSSPEQGHFYRSFFGWVGLWAMIAMVTGIAVWFVVGAVGGPNVRQSIAADAGRPSEQKEPEVPAPTVSGAVIAKETATPAAPSPEPTSEGGVKKIELITEGITVQVLNGTGDARAAQALADKLTGLGYTVIAVEESSRLYEETTVFWSAEATRDAAVALSDRFGWVSDAKPANLSEDVSFHVVVGADES